MRLQTETNLLSAHRSRIQEQQQDYDERKDRFAEDAITVLINEGISSYRDVDNSLLDGRSILSNSEGGSLNTEDEALFQVQSVGRPRKEI